MLGSGRRFLSTDDDLSGRKLCNRSCSFGRRRNRYRAFQRRPAFLASSGSYREGGSSSWVIAADMRFSTAAAGRRECSFERAWQTARGGISAENAVLSFCTFRLGVANMAIGVRPKLRHKPPDQQQLRLFCSMTEGYVRHRRSPLLPECSVLHSLGELVRQAHPGIDASPPQDDDQGGQSRKPPVFGQG